jgi:Protein of unknown function (DUF4038)/Domain of unknown function (DUF5060)
MNGLPVRSAEGPWRETELELTASADFANPYTDVQVWAEFEHESSGDRLRRPAFWDGERTWRIRFAAPVAGAWRWRSFSSADDPGLTGAGQVVVPEAAPSGHAFYDHGFWRMSPGGRNLVHTDGTPALLVGDTVWALPFRATEDQVRVYAADRSAKGFNAAFLMTVQPDMRAEGPRDRQADQGFDVGFEDLPTGHLTVLNPAYFRYLDRLLDILVSHQIVPVLSPLFHGFGWKGLGVSGLVVPPDEYARYCRYLVARYGARPAVYLVGSDGAGNEPQVPAGGSEVHEWDRYCQPTGIHYQPHGVNNHFQDAQWLDFQSCQTGHEAEHVQERVADMWRNLPVKAVLNGEPTYEHSGRRGKGEGWWQGHEAWSNLCAGGTMGVVYGAASLWQWRLHRDEPGFLSYFLAEGAGWREALDFEGSTYVGLVGKILADLPFLDMQPNWWLAIAMRALSVPGRFFLCYRENGGDISVRDDSVPFDYRIIDPRTGKVVASGTRRSVSEPITDPGGAPRVYICVSPEA